MSLEIIAPRASPLLRVASFLVVVVDRRFGKGALLLVLCTFLYIRTHLAQHPASASLSLTSILLMGPPAFEVPLPVE